MRPDALDRILTARGLTIWQVAKAAGVHPGFLSRLASGQRGASRDTALALLRVLDVRPSELFVMPEATLLESPLDNPQETPDATTDPPQHANPQPKTTRRHRCSH